MPPVIAITPSPIMDEQPHGAFERWAMSANYINAVVAAGGVPIVLPPIDDHTEQLLSLADGLLLSGGGDLAPELFGDQETHQATYGVHHLRDRFELDLIHAAIARDMPVLCICRGVQVLNVALSGSLHQHVPDAVPNALPHRQHEVDLAPHEISHDVSIVSGSPLASIFATNVIGANSFHHQSIKDVAPELVVGAIAADGVIEAVYHPDRQFVVGVQWHPEMMFERHPAQLKLFQAFVAATRPSIASV